MNQSHDEPGSPKVAFLTVMPSPYIQDLFSRLSQHLALRVLYLESEAPDTHWGNTAAPAYAEVLPGKWWGAGGVRMHVNPTVLQRLAATNADFYVVGGYSGWTQQHAMRWLRRTGRPWAFWGEVPGMCRRGHLANWLRRLAQIPLADACGVAAIGKRARDAYRRMAPSAVIHNLPYFCDLRPFRAVAAAPVSHAFRILYCGQLIHRKGVDVLLDAFAAFAGRHPQAELVLVGEGPLREVLQKRARSLGDRVRFAGFLPVDQLPAEFCAADVFVLPSRHDGWGVVINQALGAGLPVIATNTVGAALDLVQDGVNGFLIPPDDPPALQRAWETYVTEPAVLAAARGSALQTAAHIDLETGVQRWIDFIHAALGKFRRLENASLSLG